MRAIAEPEPAPTFDPERSERVLSTLGSAGHRMPLSLFDACIMRGAFGRVKYGRDLTTHNGRRAALDLAQELADAAVYLEQYRLEGVCDQLLLDCAIWLEYLNKQVLFVQQQVGVEP